MSELNPAELALRVAIFAGVLGMVAWFPPNFQWLVAFACLIGAAILAYEIWVTRGHNRWRWRTNLLWLVLLVGATGVLMNGLLAWMTTPLLALSAVCVALYVIAALSDNGSGNETPE